MGRVLLDRRVLCDRLGPQGAEQAIQRAAKNRLTIPRTPSTSRKQQSTSFTAVAPEWADGSPWKRAEVEDDGLEGQRERMKRVEAWLEEPDRAAAEAARDAWTTIPKEWMEGGKKEGDESSRSPSEAEPEPGEVRVGGKSVRALVSLRKRSRTGAGDRRTSSPGLNDVVGCVCHRDEVIDGEEMIQCDDCATWFHVLCLGHTANSRRDEFLCFRCTGGPLPATLRQRQASGALSVVSIREPTLVANTHTPRQRSHFPPHLALAPSPQTSLASPSPSSSKHASGAGIGHSGSSLPGTASRTFSFASRYPPGLRADYSPRSPTLYRRGNNRLLATPTPYIHSIDESSMDVDERRSRQRSSSPVTVDVSASSSSILLDSDGCLLPPLDGCDIPLRGNATIAAAASSSSSSSLLTLPLDITSTPSRGLSNAALGVHTPSSSHHANSSHHHNNGQGPPTSRARARRLSFGVPLTPSQDFFQHLHHETGGGAGMGSPHKRMPSCPSPAAYRTPKSLGSTATTSTTAVRTVLPMTTSSPSSSAKARRERWYRAGASGLGIGFDGGVRLDGASIICSVACV
jgi:hypothetical protein